MLANKTLVQFLDETASNSPAPGGGSIAAMSAATSVALSEMVANLTLGKKNYDAVQDEMKDIAGKLPAIRKELLEDIDRDANSFNDVMTAFKMPKETDEEKAARKAAIQEGMKKAAEVPLEVAKKSYDIMAYAMAMVERGNTNAVTDGAVAAMMARTAVLSALLNVKINLASIKDEEYVARLTKEVKELEENAMKFEQEILAKVEL